MSTPISQLFTPPKGIFKKGKKLVNSRSRYLQYILLAMGLYKEYVKKLYISIRKAITRKKWTKVLNRHFTKGTLDGQYKKYLTSFVIRKV